MRELRRRLRHPTVQALGRTLDVHCPTRVVPLSADPEPGADADSCSICLASLVSGEYIRTLSCPAALAGHTFHRECIDEWFFRNIDHMTCPLCNTDCSMLLNSRHAVSRVAATEVTRSTSLTALPPAQ